MVEFFSGLRYNYTIAHRKRGPVTVRGERRTTKLKESNMKFHIISDSSCDLGRERLDRLGIGMVSYYVGFEDEPYYREERDIPTHQFYQMMADRPGVFPKTSMPTVEDYLDAFRPLAAQGKIGRAHV